MKRLALYGLGLAAFSVVGFSLLASSGLNAGLPKLPPKFPVKPPPKPTVKPPSLSCVESTRIRITLDVCAGSLGLPYGFVIQWMTLDDYAANGGWYASRLCQATFSKSAGFGLGRNQCIEVDIGDTLGDQGATTDCVEPLNCGTTYVFRLVCLGALKYKSKTTGNVECSTQACDSNGGGGCALSQGYWKTHVGLDQNGNPVDFSAWPNSIVNAGGMTIGNVFYSLVDLYHILWSHGTMGNQLPQLAHQIIAVEFSVAYFGWAPNSDETQECLDDAHAAVGNVNVLTGTLSGLGDLIDCLDDYIQENHCVAE
jgi:hypothetical protein